MTDSKPKIIVLHPSPFLVQTVDDLLRRFAPHIRFKNIIIEDLLERAQAGISENIIDELRQAIQSAKSSNNPVVLCSCSTLGGLAETLGKELGVRVLRIDRGMAEKAVKDARRIAVVAAVESTIGPTSDLLKEVAREKGLRIEIQEVLVEKAWKLKLSGDAEGYIVESAKAIKSIADNCNAIVLAQGSMAKAKDLCSDVATPILTSPELGVKAAIAMAMQPQ